MSYELPKHRFTLLCGVECETRMLTGEDYETISRQREKGGAVLNYDELFANIICRLGSLDVEKMPKEERLDISRKIMEKDRRLILCETRQFSMGDPEKFRCTVTYTTAEGGKGEIEKEIDLEGGHFPTKPMRQRVKEYAELNTVLELVLPVTKQTVKIPLLTGALAAEFSKIKEKDYTLLTNVKHRKPTYKKAEGVWVALDLTKLPARDIAFIQSELKAEEGAVDTELEIEHPDADKLPVSKRKIIVDVINTPDFFFPSAV